MAYTPPVPYLLSPSLSQSASHSISASTFTLVTGITETTSTASVVARNCQKRSYSGQDDGKLSNTYRLYYRRIGWPPINCIQSEVLHWNPDMRRLISRECGAYWKVTENVCCGQEASFKSMIGMMYERSGGGSRGSDITYYYNWFPFSYQSNLVIFVSPTIATVQWNIVRRRLVLLSLSSGIGFVGEVHPEVNPSSL